jgi:hypothetical protein
MYQNYTLASRLTTSRIPGHFLGSILLVNV